VVRRIVESSGEILGSRLALALKDAVPDWSAETYGVRSLREFILAHVPSVVVAGRSGMDVVYGPSASTPTDEVARASADVDRWRVWVSPNSPFTLAVKASDGGVVVHSRSSATPDDHVRLDPATTDEHRSIARDFLDRAPAGRGGTWSAIIDASDASWWQRWLDEVRAAGLLSDWNSFRHQALKSKLTSRLHDLGLEPSLAETALAAICAGGSPRAKKADHQFRSSPRGADATSVARRVAVRVVEQMGEQEIRELRLPLGLVLDALKNIKA